MANANFLSTLIAALGGSLVGWLWYGPVFGKARQRAARPSTLQFTAREPLKFYGMLLLLSIISAIFLGHLLKATGVSKPYVIMMISTGIALGFIVPAIGTNYLIERKTIGLFLIDAAYFIVCYALMGLIFLTMGV
jgi:hypothetical protein